MAITYQTVKEDQESAGWALISEEYKNRMTPQVVECPNHHRQERTYQSQRDEKICEQCQVGKVFNYSIEDLPDKEEGIKRIQSQDAATQQTGYAIFDDKKLICYGVHREDSDNITKRTNFMKRWLIKTIKEKKIDRIILENIQLQTYGNNGNTAQVEQYRKQANLQGVLLDAAFEMNTPVDQVYSTTWRKVCGIGGRSREDKKEQTLRKVNFWYGLSCTEDEADAICVGKSYILSGGKYD